ncbi:MAG TPA: hypothetical protein VFI47_17830 [Acidimicrobiales bacterium]|nr:hypothetical protein [Acidimicrobiales bacterium]
MEDTRAPRPRRPPAVGDAAPTLAVDPSAPRRRPSGRLVDDWHRESGSRLPLGEWADPATRRLAASFEGPADLVAVEHAVVAFAQARAGAGHPAEAVAADLTALVRLAWPAAADLWTTWADPVGLLARALGAWAAEREAGPGSGDCIDPVTGLVSAAYLRARVAELHAQCDALAIAPQVTFGAVAVQLALGAATAPERIGVRVAAGRILARRFRAGETVAAPSTSRLVVVMPAYGVDRGIDQVTADLAGLAAPAGVAVTVTRRAFGADGPATFASLAGVSVGS